MQKVSNSQKEKKSLFKQIQNFIKKRKQEKENAYNFIFEKCYKHYLEKILEERQKSGEVDIPHFLNKGSLADCEKARELAKKAIWLAEKKYGRKHIERCYKALTKK